MKKIITLFTTLLLLGWSLNTMAFTCMAGGVPYNSGSVKIFIDLQPEIHPGQNLVVDLSRVIRCKNDYGWGRDRIWLTQGSFQPSLSAFRGSIRWAGSTMPMPFNALSAPFDLTEKTLIPLPSQVYLSPVGGAAGVVIKKGQEIFTLRMKKRYYHDGHIPDEKVFTWRIVSNHDVVIPVGGCDVNDRNINVTLPEFANRQDIPVGLSVYCAKNQKLNFFLSGTTVPTDISIFKNTANASAAASGVGIQIKRSGITLNANQHYPLGTVGTSLQSLDLKANYKESGGQITAGKVQSVIGVTFEYH